MLGLRINEDLYAAVIAAKRDIDWDEYFRKPKRMLAIDHTCEPPMRQSAIINNTNKSILQIGLIV